VISTHNEAEGGQCLVLVQQSGLRVACPTAESPCTGGDGTNGGVGAAVVQAAREPCRREAAAGGLPYGAVYDAVVEGGQGTREAQHRAGHDGPLQVQQAASNRDRP
jgi:hypothetical protein